MEYVLTFLGALNPYGIMNWLAMGYALHVSRKTNSVLLLLLAVLNALFGAAVLMRTVF